MTTWTRGTAGLLVGFGVLSGVGGCGDDAPAQAPRAAGAAGTAGASGGASGKAGAGGTAGTGNSGGGGSAGKAAAGANAGGASGTGGRGGSSGTGGSGEGGASGEDGSAGDGLAGEGAQGGDSGTGGSSAGGAGMAGTAGVAGGSAGSDNGTYQPPADVIGGACTGTPVFDSTPCSSAPVQSYCSTSDPTRVIMATCSASSPSQCEAVQECEPGWHACSATDYVARGGRDVAPNFSTTNRAWLAACVRDVSSAQFMNNACSVCDQEPNRPPSVQWYCDGTAVYAGGMAGDTLGIHTFPECTRVGENTDDHGAFWRMGFSASGPTFVVCCLDDP